MVWTDTHAVSRHIAACAQWRTGEQPGLRPAAPRLAVKGGADGRRALAGRVARARPALVDQPGLPGRGPARLQTARRARAGRRQVRAGDSESEGPSRFGSRGALPAAEGEAGRPAGRGGRCGPLPRAWRACSGGGSSGAHGADSERFGSRLGEISLSVPKRPPAAETCNSVPNDSERPRTGPGARTTQTRPRRNRGRAPTAAPSTAARPARAARPQGPANRPPTTRRFRRFSLGSRIMLDTVREASLQAAYSSAGIRAARSRASPFLRPSAATARFWHRNTKHTDLIRFARAFQSTG